MIYDMPAVAVDQVIFICVRFFSILFIISERYDEDMLDFKIPKQLSKVFERLIFLPSLS